MECLRAAERIGLAAEPEVHERAFQAADAVVRHGHVGVVTLEPPELDDLIRLGAAAREHKRWAIAGVLERSEVARQTRDVALDLGVCAVDEVDPLASALAVVESGLDAPWSVSARTLGREDRARLSQALGQTTRTAGHLLRDASGLLRLVEQPEQPEQPGRVVGSARDLAVALHALRATDRHSARVESIVDDVDERAVLDVLFGPRRALSDPASKIALEPYGLPVPEEELCASASRAAAEATRIGYPVRIALASPDLRVWDHPDLSADMVDNAARVRDTFRQLMTVAQARLLAGGQLAASPRSAERILGVMVTATSEAAALLGVRAWPVSGSRVAMRIGFADPHGAAAGDQTLAVLPAPVASIERVLRRLRGADLLLRGSPVQRRTHLDAVSDVLLRLSAFVHDRRREVDSVELRPLALLLDGSVEIREACVSVSDAFERSLGTPAAAG